MSFADSSSTASTYSRGAGLQSRSQTALPFDSYVLSEHNNLQISARAAHNPVPEDDPDDRSQVTSAIRALFAHCSGESNPLNLFLPYRKILRSNLTVSLVNCNLGTK